ncbi:universal stress protein [Chromobacterium violaceum]|uniref:universal stress protein n=1 Tax=Chromobacterium TaxID=535 RepID=UPI00385BD5DC
MIRKILVDFDTSRLAVQSVSRILTMAQRLEASVTLLLIRPQLDELMTDNHQAFVQAVLQQTEGERQVVEREAQLHGVALYVEVVGSGHIADTLLAFSQQHRFDLLVVGKLHVHHRLQDAVFGEVWKQVMAQAKLPVLLLPGQDVE